MTMLLTGRAQSTLINQIHHAELFTLCDWLYEAGIRVDMILADLPYGTTACSWDEVIAFEPMWQRFKRVIKPRGAIVLTASQPFTSRLVCSNLQMFRYEWVWIKTHSPHFLLAQYRPLGIHESVLVFSKESANYYPIITKGEKKHNRSGKPVDYERKNTNFGIAVKNLDRVENDEYYPKTSLFISSIRRADMQHPTQKPVALFEYLIRTYTRAGEIVLDPCVGSGTTALAARNTQRQYVCGDSSAKYVQVARNRLAQPYTLPLFAEATA